MDRRAISNRMDDQFSKNENGELDSKIAIFPENTGHATFLGRRLQSAAFYSAIARRPVKASQQPNGSLPRYPISARCVAGAYRKKIINSSIYQWTRKHFPDGHSSETARDGGVVVIFSNGVERAEWITVR